MISPTVFIMLLFIAVILMITLDMTDHTLTALLGASVAIIYLSQIWYTWRLEMIFLNQGTELAAIYEGLPPTFDLEVFSHFFPHWIDLGTLIVILSLMVITEIAQDSGLFQFIAVKALRFSGGSPHKLMIIFCLLTFAMSSVLATTVLIVGPLTILACDALEQNPAPLLIAEAMCSNVGGITTLISSIPNMLVAGATGYDFAWFVINLLPLGFLLLGLTLLVTLRLFRKDFVTPRPQRVNDLMALDAWTMVEDRGVFYRTAILFVALIVGFIIFGAIGLTWLVALVGAGIFVLLSGIPPSRLFREVEWSALFFFIGLFIIVGCMEEFGVLLWIGQSVSLITQGNELLASVMMLWVAGMTSGAVDNIPVTATLIPVVSNVADTLPLRATGTLWGSLVVGTVLGGALTPIASAANVLTITVAEKEKRPISYSQFLKTGVILFFVYLGFSTLYMLFRLTFFPMAIPPKP